MDPLRRRTFTFPAVVLTTIFLAACQFDLTPREQPFQTATATSTSITGPIATGYSVNSQPTEATPAPTDTPTSQVIIEALPSITTTSTVVPTGGPTRYATRTRTPTRTRWPTRTPTITLTPLPPIVPVAIGVPGPLSKISSPLHMEAGVMVGDDGYVYLELKSETGQVFESKSFDYRASRGKTVYFYEDIPFTITDAAETARLTVSTRDTHGHTMALNSVEVVLLQLGDDEITPQAITLEPFIVRDPQPNQIVSGGMLMVEGLADPVNSSPVIFDLVEADGTVLASASRQIASPTGDQSHTPFQIVIPYTVSTTMQVRLTVYQQSDDRIPGIVALSSVLITVAP